MVQQSLIAVKWSQPRNQDHYWKRPLASRNGQGARQFDLSSFVVEENLLFRIGKGPRRILPPGIVLLSVERIDIRVDHLAESGAVAAVVQENHAGMSAGLKPKRCLVSGTAVSDRQNEVVVIAGPRFTMEIRCQSLRSDWERRWNWRPKAAGSSPPGPSWERTSSGPPSIAKEANLARSPMVEYRTGLYPKPGVSALPVEKPV